MRLHANKDEHVHRFGVATSKVKLTKSYCNALSKQPSSVRHLQEESPVKGSRICRK
ncbi:unnamed protein product [Acanthoscelides obtectus]|uniref:Uncharacterized protein n=1 Tax=Acanthoscelides obtectus TaxID=200917 RepID=A0A9P0LTN4_ACAOB|nr:unnamed protein product [Acanthoscelides obtectus]CAK1648261.1 hypothetical protein AOBTE_LOCUS15622 [Acanthoscelides obtectus]